MVDVGEVGGVAGEGEVGERAEQGGDVLNGEVGTSLRNQGVNVGLLSRLGAKELHRRTRRNPSACSTEGGKNAP